MSELDFTKPVEPAKTSIYDPAMATEFFSSSGKTETVAKGATIFAENEKGSRLLLRRDKMYLLLDGEVGLIAKNKVIAKIGQSRTCPAASSGSTMASFRAPCAKDPSSRSC